MFLLYRSRRYEISNLEKQNIYGGFALCLREASVFFFVLFIVCSGK